MTTWEPASDADKQAIRLLIDQLRRAGIPLPTLPATARAENLVGLTKRDAGSLTTLLRDALNDTDPTRRT